MTFAEINGKQVQVESLEGVMKIVLDCEDVELTLESDSELRAMAQLISTGGDRAPVLRRDGAVLQVNQHGRYRNTATLRLPVSGSPPLSGSHAKGDLTIERINAEVALQHGVGNVRVERGSGDLSLDNGKGDVAVRDRTGMLGLRVGSGNVNVQRCVGGLTINTGKGDIQAIECDGELRTQTGSGNVQVTSGSGHFIAKSGSGDVYVNRPHEQCLSISTASGNVLVRDGTVLGMAIGVARGDVTSSARLQLPPEGIDQDLEDALEAANIDFQGLEQKIARAVEDAIGRAGHHLKTGDLGFEASDSGVRITRGGVPVFEANDSGVRFKKGNFAFEASDAGVRIKRGAAAGQGAVPPGTFDIETHSGNIMLDVPYGAPMRVEALVASGEVRSDVPLVTVGRPGPRGSTQRFVGGTTPGTEPRMSLRLKTDRGDIRVRAIHTVVAPPPAPPPPASRPSTPAPPRMMDTSAVVVTHGSPVGPDAPTSRVSIEQTPTSEPRELTEREERMQTILEALAGGSLSVAEAERLLRALDE